MKDSVLKLDIFRKLPKDLTEPTFCGAIGKSTILFPLILCSFNDLHRALGFAGHQ